LPEDRVEAWPGRPFPFGPSYDGSGTNFALFSEVAEAVDLCLFDDAGTERRVRLEEVDAFSWHAYLPNVGVVVLGMPFTFQRILRAIVYINVTPRFRIRVIGYLDAWTTFQAIAFRVFAVKSEDVGAMSKLA